MSDGAERYVPAAGRAAFTRLYDPFMALTMRERAWRGVLVGAAAAALPSDGTAVDVGAGTGEVAIALAALRPSAAVVALDGDPAALGIARGKRGAERVDWREAMAHELPLESGGADVAVMSLLLHHLNTDAKRAALTEAARVLRAGGSLFIADWGRPRGIVPRAGFVAVRLLDGLDPTRDHGRGLLPRLVESAGFGAPELLKRVPTPWGTLELSVARSPQMT